VEAGINFAFIHAWLERGAGGGAMGEGPRLDAPLLANLWQIFAQPEVSIWPGIGCT